MNYKLFEKNDDFDGNEVILPSNQDKYENVKLFFKNNFIEVLSIIFLIIINIVFYIQFEKPTFGDTCAGFHNITSNSTCHHQLICATIGGSPPSNVCIYRDLCDECYPFLNWTLIILVLNCFPSAIFWSCLEYFYPHARFCPE